jgi:hypothetical protein
MRKTKEFVWKLRYDGHQACMQREEDRVQEETRTRSREKSYKTSSELVRERERERERETMSNA